MKMKQIYSLAVLLLFSFFASAQQPSSADTGEVNPGKQLIILQTSDTHSRIEPISPEAADDYAGMGGAVRRSSFIKEIRSKHPDVLLFDCGDISQGTPYYNLFQGEVEIKMMNLMKYDAMTIGNHEFDFGLDNLARLLRKAEFPVVCANYDFSGTPVAGLVKPYVILHRNGLKIGVFGVSPRLEGLVAADNYRGVGYTDPVEAARSTARLLKRQKHCDVIVCLSHLGWAQMPADVDDSAMIAGSKYIDLVLGGHSHSYFERLEYVSDADGRRVPVDQNGKHGVFVGKVEMTIRSKR